jgi:creatinine amidohydrolase
MSIASGLDESPGGPRRWEQLTGPDIGQLLAEDPRQVCLMPVGATEQHGPHLPTGTDTIIANLLCDEVSRRTGALILPALSLGASFGHGTTFAGTLSATPEEVAGQVRRTVEWAAYSGVRRLVVVNAHVGNTAALSVAGDHLRFEREDIRVGVVNWWQLNEWVAKEVSADGEDWHANRAETSLLLALTPELVDMSKAATADDRDRSGDLIFRYTARGLSTNGVTGRPSSATLDLGTRLRERVVAALVELLKRARDEEPPLVGAQVAYPGQR